MTCVVSRWAEHAQSRKPMSTVLPDPVGPQIRVWPVSLRLPPSGSEGSLACSEKWYGERALVMSSASASPQ